MTSRLLVPRREFLRQVAAGVAVAGLPAAAAPDDAVRKGALVRGRKINIACVGCGGKGRSDVKGMEDENIVALCDVDAKRASATFGKYPDVPKYSDFRVMLREMDEHIVVRGGRVERLSRDFVDENRKGLAAWTA